MKSVKTNANHNAIRIALYNHKGGVGKTTLTVNIAAALASLGKKILLVDSDPQCNLTSYLIEDSVVDNLLDESDSDDGETIWSALKPIVDASGKFKYVQPKEPGIKNLELLPGDIRLAEYDFFLNRSWGDCFQRMNSGFRGTNSLSGLVAMFVEKHKYDYVFYDTGPNIGPLNRIILLDCDYFIIPAACDLFSLRALKSLGHTLALWTKDWDTILKLAPQDTYMMHGKPKFLGYIPQRFKVYRGQSTAGSSKYIVQLEKVIFSDVISVLRNIDITLATKSIRGTKLGEVKDFSSLVQQSQKLGIPMWDVSSAVSYQVKEAEKIFFKIAQKIINKCEKE